VSVLAPNALASAFLTVTVMGFFVSLGLIVDEDDVLASLFSNSFALCLLVVLEEVHVGVLSVQLPLQSFQLSGCLALLQLGFFI